MAVIMQMVLFTMPFDIGSDYLKSDIKLEINGWFARAIGNKIISNIG